MKWSKCVRWFWLWAASADPTWKQQRGREKTVEKKWNEAKLNNEIHPPGSGLWKYFSTLSLSPSFSHSSHSSILSPLEYSSILQTTFSDVILSLSCLSLSSRPQDKYTKVQASTFFSFKQICCFYTIYSCCSLKWLLHSTLGELLKTKNKFQFTLMLLECSYRFHFGRPVRWE